VVQVDTGKINIFDCALDPHTQQSMAAARPAGHTDPLVRAFDAYRQQLSCVRLGS
jgi:hypothetical protein